ncbi:sugar ABC transporter permease, partial [Streptomyces sp. NPDC008086]
MSLTAGSRPDGTRPPAAVEEPAAAVAAASPKVSVPSKAGKAGKVPFRVRLRRDRALILMTLPVIVLLVIFNYVPLLGNVVAFQDYDPYVSSNGVTAIFHSPWVGVEQFS